MRTTASAMTATLAAMLTNLVFTSVNDQRFTVYNAIGKLFTGILINGLHRCPRHFHLTGALFLCKSLPINQTDGFILVYRHFHRTGFIGKPGRRKPGTMRRGANFAPFLRPWQSHHLILDILAYVRYYYTYFSTYVNNLCFFVITSGKSWEGNLTTSHSAQMMIY